MIPLKEYVQQCCTRTRALRIKNETEDVLYDGTASRVPAELLEANWLVKMMELSKGSALNITVVRGGL